MLNVRMMTDSDIYDIKLSDHQKREQEIINKKKEDGVFLDGITLEKDGRVLALGGFHPFWSGRCYAWIMISEAMKPHDWVALYRGVIKLLDSLQKTNKEYRRIETTCDIEDEKSIRWLEMLGFSKEGVMRSYTPDGKDHFLFSRIWYGR